MSIEAAAWAFEQEGITPAEKLALIAIADNAGEFHHAYSEPKPIMQMAMVSRGEVKELIRGLLRARLIVFRDTEFDAPRPGAPPDLILAVEGPLMAHMKALTS